MAKKRFYKLKEGFTRVIKKDIYDGKVVFLRSDVEKGIRAPYGFNIVGRYRIGIREVPATKGSDRYKWVYCSDLCKENN